MLPGIAPCKHRWILLQILETSDCQAFLLLYLLQTILEKMSVIKKIHFFDRKSYGSWTQKMEILKAEEN